jgi:hypothetical protein
MKPGDIDWEYIFGELGVRWFHTGGIYAALSETTPDVVIEAVKAAKKHGTIVSYDLNYRPSLWKSIGGHAKAQEVNREIAKVRRCHDRQRRGLHRLPRLRGRGRRREHLHHRVDSFKKMIERAVAAFPNFKATATTLRACHRHGQRLGRDLSGTTVSSFESRHLSETRDLRPRRRRRQLCLRLILRFHGSTTRRRRSTTAPPTAPSP